MSSAASNWLAFFLLSSLVFFRVKSPDWRDALAILFALWAGVTLLWTPDPSLGTWAWLKLASACLLYMGLRRTGFPLGLLGALVALSCLLDWFLLENGGHGNPNFLAEFVLISLPLLVYHKWGRWAAVVGGIWLLGADTKLQWYIVIVAGFAGCLSLVTRDWWAVFSAAGIATVAAGFLSVNAGSWSVLYRLDLWLSTLAMWLSRPWGNGLASFNYLQPSFNDAELPTLELLGLGDFGAISESWSYAGATHNEYLQALAELGPLGLLPLLLVRRGSPQAMLSIGAVLALSAVDFPLQNAPTLFVAVLALALLSPRPEKGRNWSAPALACTLGFTAGDAMASAWWFARVEPYMQISPGMALYANVQAYEAFPAEFAPRLQLFRSLVQAMNAGTTVDRGAVEEAYAISQSASPDQPGLLIARGYFLAKTGCTQECVEIRDRLTRQSGRVWQVRKAAQ